jgi:hypothetical protein
MENVPFFGWILDGATTLKDNPKLPIVLVFGSFRAGKP